MATLFARQLIDIILMLIIYVELIIFILAISGFWNLSFLKDSISWFIFAGIPLVFSFQKVNTELNGELSNLAIEMLSVRKNLHNINLKFTKYLQSQFTIEKLSKKLQNWHELAFGDFIKELNKAIKKGGGEKLTKTDEMDWMDVFETKKAEAQSLKVEIEKTDSEIDQMVYKLYELTGEEIAIVVKKGALNPL